MTTNLSALYGSGGGSGKWKSQTFTASGVWQRPPGVEVVKVLLVAGGGSGGMFNQGGNNGGNSSFGSLITARGGLAGPSGGSVSAGGAGGGVGSGFAALATTVSSQTYTTWGFYTYNPTSPSADINGYVFGGDAGPTQVSGSSYPTTIQNGGTNGSLGFSSPFGSSGAGGGGYGWSVSYSGGNVIGFGTGGSGAGSGTSSGGGGGGASYGNGGYATGLSYVNGQYVSTPAGNGNLGGGGGGASGGGGGGGEIILRELPVSTDQTIVIASGGASISKTVRIGQSNVQFVSGAGGNGLCIVFWQE